MASAITNALIAGVKRSAIGCDQDGRTGGRRRGGRSGIRPILPYAEPARRPVRPLSLVRSGGIAGAVRIIEVDPTVAVIVDAVATGRGRGQGHQNVGRLGV